MNDNPKARNLMDELESPFLSYELFSEEETGEAEWETEAISSPYLGELIFEQESEDEFEDEFEDDEDEFEEGEKGRKLLSPKQVEKAVRNNPIYARHLGWQNHIDKILELLYDPVLPEQTLTTYSEEFAQLVAHWQANHAVYPIDGILGHETWYKMRETIKVKGTSTKSPDGVLTPEQVNEALRKNRKYRKNWKDYKKEIIQLLSKVTQLDITDLEIDSDDFVQLVAEWQRKNSFAKIDGVIGPNTWEKMKRVYASPLKAEMLHWEWVTLNTRVQYVMKLLVDKYKYPINAAAGIVGNLWRESHVLPNLIEGSTIQQPMKGKDRNGIKGVTFTAKQVMNRGKRTHWAQVFLNKKFIKPTEKKLVEDGDMGPKTKEAIRTFQRLKLGLTTQDDEYGKLGAKTIRAMTDAGAGTPPEREEHKPDKGGIGLAQWTTPWKRRAGLFEHIFEGKKLGGDILYNMDAQVDYIVYELQHTFKGLEKALRGKISVKDASDKFCKIYERPGKLGTSDENAVLKSRSDASQDVIKLYPKREEHENEYSLNELDDRLYHGEMSAIEGLEEGSAWNSALEAQDSKSEWRLIAEHNQEEHSWASYDLEDDESEPKYSLFHEEEKFEDEDDLEHLEDERYNSPDPEQYWKEEYESEEDWNDEIDDELEEEQEDRVFPDSFTELSSLNEIDLEHIEDERYNSPESYQYWSDMENESEEDWDDEIDDELEEEQEGRVFSDDLPKFSSFADHTVAIPAFQQRTRDAIASLLSPNDLKNAIKENQKRHPRKSGVSPSDIRTDLARYVNFEIISKTIKKAIESDEVFAEAVHQFQIKCFCDPKQQDGIAGTSTLDSLGIINQKDRTVTYDPRAKNILKRINISSLTDGEFTAGNWFDSIINPSFLGWNLTGGGVHILLVRQLREAERWLLSKHGNMTPVQLWEKLHDHVGEIHLGLRKGTNMHSFGLAFDILYEGNPHVGNPKADRHKFNTTLLSAVKFANSTNSKDQQIQFGRKAWAFFHTLASQSTHEAYRKVSRLNSAFVDYVMKHPKAFRMRFQQRRSVFQRGKVTSKSFRNPLNGFLSLEEDLVVALRDKARLAWGGIDLGPNESGDMMHFDMRSHGVGRKIAQVIGGYVGKETKSSSPSSNQFDLDYAIERNRYWRKMLGWQNNFDDITGLLGLSPQTTPSEQAFAEAVARWQSQNRISPADGIIGKKTWEIMKDILYRTSSAKKYPWE